MKKLLLTLTIAVLATVTFGQKYFVTIEKLPENLLSLDKTFLNKIDHQILKINQEFESYKMNQFQNLDTIYNEENINLFLNQLEAIRIGMHQKYTVTDTIPIIKRNGEYYFVSDSLGLSISERKLILETRLTKNSNKFGKDKTESSNQGKLWKKDISILNDFENQLNKK